jgi:hypothetical protein
LRVLGGVDIRRSFDFFLILSSSCSVYFDFEIFFTLLLGLPIFVSFIGLVVFLLVDELLKLLLTFLVF